MKKTITILVALFIWLSLAAQAPEKMSYQAVVRNTKGELVKKQTVGMKISIEKYVFGIPPRYTAVFSETQTPVTDENGLISIAIGTGTLVSGSVLFKDIDWAGESMFIRTDIDPAGGTNYTITARSQLLSVPYALHAKNAKTYKVGDFAHGGIVFMVDESGQHGLVCAITDQSTGIRWHAGTNVRTRAFSSSGKENTLLIIAVQAAVSDDLGYYAAQICNQYDVKKTGLPYDYNGWYLPSLEELELMYRERTKINEASIVNGGTAFQNANYWSSTEFGSPAFAFFKNLSTGESSTDTKTETYRVRAVRAF